MAKRVTRYGRLLSMVAMSLAVSCGDGGMDDGDGDDVSAGEHGAGGRQAGSGAGRSGDSNPAGTGKGGSVAGAPAQAGSNGLAGEPSYAGAGGESGAGGAGGEAGAGGEGTPQGGKAGKGGSTAGAGTIGTAGGGKGGSPGLAGTTGGGGKGGSAGTTAGAGVAGAVSGGAAGAAATCESCMEKNCPAPLEALDSQCAGTVCEDLQACFDENECDEEDPRLCYCGAVAFTDCLSSFVSTLPNGACKAEIDEALVPAFLPVNIPQLMAPFLLETTNPVGANFQVAICQTRECATLCNTP